MRTPKNSQRKFLIFNNTSSSKFLSRRWLPVMRSLLPSKFSNSFLVNRTVRPTNLFFQVVGTPSSLSHSSMEKPADNVDSDSSSAEGVDEEGRRPLARHKCGRPVAGSSSVSLFNC